MNTQYAVCHLERGKGNDSGMSCHIERQKANGEVHIPDNADASRTHLNREYITFPEGVANRTQAIQHRLANAGLARKVGKNQCQCVRIILSGSHERMIELAEQERIDDWCKDNIEWLRRTYGADNLVSCVLHMDEKTPHLHATVIPIVTTPRKRREREGEAKYKPKVAGPRLCADEIMARSKLRQYQTSYGKAMADYGLQRGVVASSANHKTQQQYHREQIIKYQEDIEQLLAKIEELKSQKSEQQEAVEDGKSRFWAYIGKGELPKLRKDNTNKAKRIAELEKQLAETKKLLADEKAARQRDRGAYQTEIDRAVKRAVTAEKKAEASNAQIAKLNDEKRELHCKAYPERYRLSSGADLINWCIPNRRSPHLSITTQFRGEEFRTAHYNLPEDLMHKLDTLELTPHEVVNMLFEPWEQVHESQHHLLAIALQTASGGTPTAHVGTGGGGSTSDLPWRDRKNDEYRKRRT